MNPESMAQDIKDLKETNTKILVALAELPEKIFEKADCRYASKTAESEIKSIETEVKNIKRNQESRAFEWIKIMVTIIVTVVLTLLADKQIQL